MQCHSCIGKAKREHAASNVAEMSQIDSYFTSASAEEFLLKQDPLEILKKCKVLHIQTQVLYNYRYHIHINSNVFSKLITNRTGRTVTVIKYVY